MRIEELVPGLNLEDGTTEFKRIIEEGRSEDSGKQKEISWLKTIAAFANTSGGTIYIGVDNKSHEVIPLDHDTTDKIALMIQRLVRQRLEPEVSYDISVLPVKLSSQTLYVIKVSVPKSKVLPVTLHEDGLLGIYVRNFSSSVLASPWQIRDLILLSDNTPYDQPMTDEVYNPDEFETLRAVYRERIGRELDAKVLVSAGFMNEQGKLSRGALLFKDGHADKKTKTVCSQWPGINKGSPVVIASAEFEGNILDIIQSVIGFVANHSANGYKKEADSRVDFFSYPARSVTEGIVNAVAHRNYYIDGSQISVDLFRDRLEITSPGSLLGVSSLDREKNISSIMPRRRNEVICNILVYCRYMESKGSGFDKIAEDYIGKGEAFRPFVSANGTSFTLTLPDLTYPAGVIDEDSIPPVFTETVLEGRNDLQILSFCYQKARTVKEIAEYIGVKPSTYFRKDVLGSLVSKACLIEDNSSSPVRYQSNHAKVFVM